MPFLRSFLTIILPRSDLDFFRSLQVFEKRVYYIWSKSFKIEKLASLQGFLIGSLSLAFPVKGNLMSKE